MNKNIIHQSRLRHRRRDRPGSERQLRSGIATLAVLLLPGALVVLLIGSLGAGAAAQAVSLPPASQQLPPRAEPHPLAISINYSHDWVLGEYAPAHTIWVTVTNEAGTVKATAALTTIENVPNWGGTGFATWVGDSWQPEPPDLSPGDWVYAAADTGANTSAQIGQITGAVDAEADSITGAVTVPWLLPGPLDVYCRGWGAPAGAPEKQDSVTPDGLDPYTCAWNPTTEWDVEGGQDLAVIYETPEGHEIIAVFQAPPELVLQVNYTHDWVQGGYPPGYTLWMTVTNESGAVKATAELTTGPVPGWDGPGFATHTGNPWQPMQPDLAPGDWVLADMDNGKRAAVQIGQITGAVDVDADSIAGAVNAPWLLPGPLTVYCRGWDAPGAPDKQDSVTPDGLDPYTCAWNPTSEWDVGPGQDLAVSYYAPEGHEVIAVFQDGSFYVDGAAGQDTAACGAQTAPCRTIGYTLADRAGWGATIYVAGGVYTEHLVIPFSATLLGGFDPVTWNRNLSVYETVVNAAAQPSREGERYPVVEVANDAAEVTLDGPTLTGGSSELAGGVLAGSAAVTLRNCYIHHNHADGNPDSQAGAGVLAFHGPALVIENSRIVHNTMGMNPGGAAGIRSHSAPLTLINSVVADNRGEMAVHTNAPATLLHSTVADADGGVLVNPPETAQLQILNSIIHGTDWAIGLGELGVADVRYTLVAGGYDGDGNIDADPLFVDPANGDYKLQAGSPAVNAGTANYPDPLIADLEGRTRDWQPDMGAYELPLLDRDAAARGVILPATAAVGQPLQPVAAVLNAGAAALADPAPVHCTIALDAALLYSQTATAAAPWPPLVWQSLEFPPFTPAAAGVYTVTCSTRLAGDERPENDSYTQTLAVVDDAADGWSQDNLADNGTVPSGLNDWYQSPDIWVRHADDGGVVHQDPIAGVPNYVYARLRNRGTQPLTGTLELSWIAPSLGARCGDWAPIGAVPFANLLPGELRIVKTAWTPTQSGHTCLQALQESAADPYNRALECTPLWVPWDNNLTWRNVNIFDNPAAPGRSVAETAAAFDLVNPYNTAQAVDLLVDKRQWPTGGSVLLTLPGELFADWVAAGAPGTNIEVLTPTQQVRLTAGAQSALRELPLNAAASATLAAAFTGPAGADFMLSFTAQIHGAAIGGVDYRWVVDATPPAVQAAAPAPGSTSVAVDAPIVLTFSRAMAPESLSLTANPLLAGWQTAWNEAGTVATVTHGPLHSDAAYTVTALAFDGNGIALAAPYTWSFHTEARVYLPTVVR